MADDLNEIKNKIIEIDSRLRIVEQDNSKIVATMENLTKTLTDFVGRLDKREDEENKRFEKFETSITYLQRLSYIGIGALALAQFLVANGFIGVK